MLPNAQNIHNTITSSGPRDFEDGEYGPGNKSSKIINMKLRSNDEYERYIEVMIIGCP